MKIGIALVVLALIAGGAVFTQSREQSVAEVATTQAETARPAEAESVAAELLPSEPEVETNPVVSEVIEAPAAQVPETVAQFTDGTYTAPASYFTPRRTKHDMDITLTIVDDIITAAVITYDGGVAQTPIHSRFDEAYRAEIIGQPLEQVSLSRTGGASLTSGAFNEALVEIKTQAS